MAKKNGSDFMAQGRADALAGKPRTTELTDGAWQAQYYDRGYNAAVAEELSVRTFTRVPKPEPKSIIPAATRAHIANLEKQIADGTMPERADRIRKKIYALMFKHSRAHVHNILARR